MIDSEELCARGVLLMIFLKAVVIGWVGLDPDAWYVWPWTWVAFGMMAPAIVEWVTTWRAD